MLNDAWESIYLQRRLCLALLFSFAFVLTRPILVAGQWYYTTSGGTVTITGSTYYNSTLTVPSTIAGLPVTAIGNSALANQSILTTLTIPSSVTSIGYRAFANCPNLVRVFFLGDAPNLGGFNAYLFDGSYLVTVYHLAGTAGWGATFGNRSTFLWDQPTKLAYTTDGTSVTVVEYTGWQGK